MENKKVGKGRDCTLLVVVQEGNDVRIHLAHNEVIHIELFR